MRARLPTSPEEDEGRSQREQKKPVDRTGSRQNRAVDRKRQSAGESSQQKSGEADGRERRLLGPVDPEAGLANVRG